MRISASMDNATERAWLELLQAVTTNTNLRGVKRYTDFGTKTPVFGKSKLSLAYISLLIGSLGVLVSVLPYHFIYPYAEEESSRFLSEVGTS